MNVGKTTSSFLDLHLTWRVSTWLHLTGFNFIIKQGWRQRSLVILFGRMPGVTNDSSSSLLSHLLFFPLFLLSSKLEITSYFSCYWSCSSGITPPPGNLGHWDRQSGHQQVFLVAATPLYCLIICRMFRAFRKNNSVLKKRRKNERFLIQNQKRRVTQIIAYFDFDYVERSGSCNGCLNKWAIHIW